ncbi:MAG: hypothetical protein LBC92_03415 [Rickettsiales bacterium]|nr:hypothetical protein [Rickettsiales bacterium]
MNIEEQRKEALEAFNNMSPEERRKVTLETIFEYENLIGYLRLKEIHLVESEAGDVDPLSRPHFNKLLGERVGLKINNFTSKEKFFENAVNKAICGRDNNEDNRKFFILSLLFHAVDEDNFDNYRKNFNKKGEFSSGIECALSSLLKDEGPEFFKILNKMAKVIENLCNEEEIKNGSVFCYTDDRGSERRVDLSNVSQKVVKIIDSLNNVEKNCEEQKYNEQQIEQMTVEEFRNLDSDKGKLDFLENADTQSVRVINKAFWKGDIVMTGEEYRILNNRINPPETTTRKSDVLTNKAEEIESTTTYSSQVETRIPDPIKPSAKSDREDTPNPIKQPINVKKNIPSCYHSSIEKKPTAVISTPSQGSRSFVSATKNNIKSSNINNNGRH